MLKEFLVQHGGHVFVNIAVFCFQMLPFWYSCVRTVYEKISIICNYGIKLNMK